MLMSSVHPRTKKHVGDRLAAGAWRQAYGKTKDPGVGPVISGCEVHGDKIVLLFNTTLLASDAVLFKGYNKTNNASATQVLFEPFPRAFAEGNADKGPKVYDYPPWQTADITAGADNRSIVVDLSAFGPGAGAKVTGVRYARWAKVSHPLCCGNVDFGLTPCPPDSCPISGDKSGLPAMPFEAEVVQPMGKCKCVAPQVCDE